MSKRNLGVIALSGLLSLAACDSSHNNNDTINVQADTSSRARDVILDAGTDSLEGDVISDAGTDTVEESDRCNIARITRAAISYQERAWGSPGSLYPITGETLNMINTAQILRSPFTSHGLVAGYNPQNSTITACVADTSSGGCGTVAYTTTGDEIKPFPEDVTVSTGQSNAVNVDSHIVDAIEIFDQGGLVFTQVRDNNVQFVTSYVDETGDGEWVDCQTNTRFASQLASSIYDRVDAVHRIIESSSED